MRNKSVSLWRIGPFLSIKNQAKWRKVLLVLLLEKEPISNRSPTEREKCVGVGRILCARCSIGG